MASKKTGHRYRLVTSMWAGIAVVLVLAYVGHTRHDPMPAVAGVITAVALGLAGWIAWEAVAAARRRGERRRKVIQAAGRPEFRRVPGRR